MTANRTAIQSASQDNKILTENQPQPPFPREDEKRFESDKKLNTFLDEKEMLKRLPISRRTLFNWRTSGKIPSVKIGRRCLYHYPSIEAALLRLQQNGVGE